MMRVTGTILCVTQGMILPSSSVAGGWKGFQFATHALCLPQSATKMENHTPDTQSVKNLGSSVAPPLLMNLVFWPHWADQNKMSFPSQLDRHSLHSLSISWWRWGDACWVWEAHAMVQEEPAKMKQWCKYLGHMSQDLLISQWFKLFFSQQCAIVFTFWFVICSDSTHLLPVFLHGWNTNTFSGFNAFVGFFATAFLVHWKVSQL